MSYIEEARCLKVNTAHINLRVLPKTVKNRLLENTRNSSKLKISRENSTFTLNSPSLHCVEYKRSRLASPNTLSFGDQILYFIECYLAE